MKLQTMQCPICCSSQVKIDGDKVICLACGNVYEKKQADSQMFVDLRLANSYRQMADFAKAAKLYQEIIAKYPQEDLTMVYWGLLLCDQEVLMEADGQGQIFPTFYRIKKYNIDQAPIYQKFYDYVKTVSPEKVRNFAERINIINKARLRAKIIQETTPPFDVFICFKKTFLDSNIVTNDYDVANEIYNNISSKYRVFYSEKSLKSLAIRDYEPNIFYGLHTAKVMILICSRKEFLESHWMKNEWNRFLELNDKKNNNYSCIIPVFIDNFDPQDLPSELSHLQGLQYGISLLGDLEDAISSIINPVDKDAEQQKQIDDLYKSIKEMKQQSANLEAEKVDNILKGKMTKASADYAIESLLKLAKVNIEDLDDLDKAYECIHKAQEIDAENYMTWYYKLLIDFRAKDMLSLVMHRNYKDSINYRLLCKYAKTKEAKQFVESIDETRENYLKDLANKVNNMLQELDNNARPIESDIIKIKNFYTSLDIDAKKYVEDLKRIVSNALGRIRTNKIDDFNCLLNAINKKEFPNNDDIIKIEDSYKELTDDEKDLVGNYKKTIVDAADKMKMGRVKQIISALEELKKQDYPDKKELLLVEKKYNSLEAQYKEKIPEYAKIMTSCYDKRYIAEVKKLEQYLSKLPTEKVANNKIYIQLENMYNNLPAKYRALVKNIQNLDDYYDLLMGRVKKEEKKEDMPKKKKKSIWPWSKE